MVNPIQTLGIKVNSFGAQLDIEFELPAVLPTSWKYYMFRRSKTDVTQAEIDSYFANIDNLANYNYNGLYVFDNFKQEDLSLISINIYSDYRVLSKVPYFYKVVIRDELTKEVSEAKGVTATPIQSIKVNIKDGKEIVAEAIKKMFDNVINTEGRKVELNRDIEIVKHFSIEPIADNYVMIERVNGSVNQKYAGGLYARFEDKIILGEVDNDVIRATFMTAHSSRRDLVTNIFRSQKPFLMQYIKKLGETQIQDVTINIEGDYYNPQVHGINQVGVTIVFVLAIQNFTSGTTYIIDEHILENLEVDNG